MRAGYSRNRLWGAALKWTPRAGQRTALRLAPDRVGFLRGCFGAWPGLTGLRIAGRPPAQMEGATYRFCHLGKDIALEVRNGVTRKTA